MNSPDVYLREIHSGNWRECIELSVDKSQSEFVSSNLFSLAQSKYETCRIPCAIYNTEDVMVGFTMYNNQPLPDGSFRISRFMIDRKQQGKGYGECAAQLVVNVLSRVAGCNEIKLDHHPMNDQAAELWRRLGFVKSGNLGDNMELCLVVS